MAGEDFRCEVAALARAAWRHDVVALDIAPLAGDASSRRYFRARFDGPVSSAVLMVQSGSGLSISSDELTSLGDAPAEMPFLNVQRYLRKHSIAVPDVYAADPARGLALLEDVGDTTLWDGAQAREDRERLYRAAVDELLRIQRAGSVDPDPECIAFRQRFDRRLFVWEFDHFLEYGFGVGSIADTDRDRLRRRFGEISEELADDAVALTHRDYHSWNLFVHEGKIRVIDFQDALLAPVGYDLATLLNDRATPTVVDPALETALVAYFCGRRQDVLGDRMDEREFRTRYHLLVLQKSLKIVGRFHYLEEVKKKRGYVAMLPHTFATLRRTFAALPALDDVRDILARAIPELA